MISKIRWIAVLMLALAPAALAVKPVEVKHSTEEDFAAGKMADVAVWNTGEVTLGRATETIMDEGDDVAMVSSLASDKDGNIYVGTASKARILKIDLDGAATTLADLEGVLVSDLKLEEGRLYATTAGDKCGLFRIDLPAKGEGKAAVKTLWTAPANTSAWAVVRIGETFYVATGGEGKIYAIAKDGKAEVVFKAKQEIIQSMIASGGNLIAGTGEEGLVYVVDPKAKTSRVLMDAAEQEIPALAVDAAGNIYVAATNGSDEAGEPGEMSAANLLMMIQSHAILTDDGDESPDVSDGGKKSDGDEDETPKSASSAGKGKGTGNKLAKPPTDTQPNRLPMLGRLGRLGKSAKVKEAEHETEHTIYRINKDGFAQPIARLDQTLLDMVLTGPPEHPRLIVSTGDIGRIYEVNPENREYAMLVSIDPKQVTTLAVEDTGMIVAGTANPATVVEISGETADEGTYLSKPIDAQQVARWGQIQLTGTVPAHAEVTVATRTGNVEEPADETWSAWSAEIPLSDAPAAITSPAGRFLQYRLTFKASENKAGVVKSVLVLYQVDNLPPEIKTITVEPQASPEAEGRGGGKDKQKKPMAYRKITIDASDPNEDGLCYDIFVRPVGRQVWLRVGKDVTEPEFAWNTAAVPDGRYELKVQASDLPDNPPAMALSTVRLDQVLVDNTPPVLADVTAKVTEDGEVMLSGLARDAAGRIEKVEYVVDSGEETTMAAPADGIYDSPQEKFAAVIKELKPGMHLVTVRAMDEFGNVGCAMIEVTTGK